MPLGLSSREKMLTCSLLCKSFITCHLRLIYMASKAPTSASRGNGKHTQQRATPRPTLTGCRNNGIVHLPALQALNSVAMSAVEALLKWCVQRGNCFGRLTRCGPAQLLAAAGWLQEQSVDRRA